MGERRIYLANEGVFTHGPHLATIRDSGLVVDAKGKVLGRFGEDGAFRVQDGWISERKVFDVSDDGSFTKESSSVIAGAAGFKDLLGRIDSYGNIYDVNGKRIAYVSHFEGADPEEPGKYFYSGQGRDSANTEANEGADHTASGIGCAAGAILVFGVIFALFTFVNIPAILGSSAYSDATKAAIFIGIALGWISMIVTTYFKVMSNNGRKVGFFEALLPILGLGAVVCTVVLTIGDAVQGRSGIASIASSVVLGIGFCSVPSLVCSAIVANVRK